MRRIYKAPSACSINQLLDFLTTLAVSNAYYKDFDPKSRSFVEEALNIVEENFTGTSHTTAMSTGEQNSAEEFKLSYFNPVPSDKRFYNKILQKELPTWERKII